MGSLTDHGSIVTSIERNGTVHEYLLLLKKHRICMSNHVEYRIARWRCQRQPWASNIMHERKRCNANPPALRAAFHKLHYSSYVTHVRSIYTHCALLEKPKLQKRATLTITFSPQQTLHIRPSFETLVHFSASNGYRHVRSAYSGISTVSWFGVYESLFLC